MTMATAFTALRKKHSLVARQHYRCCQGCALKELSIEYNAVACDDKPPGYVFFHRQDAKHLKESGWAYVRFGVFAKKRKGAMTTAEIGKLASEVFAEHGCPVDWSGKPGDCLVVWQDIETRRKHALKRLGVEQPSP
jgi:hypothetical protein